MTQASALSLHIPAARFRPGDAPDFAYLNLAAVGDTPRPPVDAPAAKIRDLAYGMVRVLDADGRAHGPWAPHTRRPDPDQSSAGDAAHPSLR